MTMVSHLFLEITLTSQMTGFDIEPSDAWYENQSDKHGDYGDIEKSGLHDILSGEVISEREVYWAAQIRSVGALLPSYVNV